MATGIEMMLRGLGLNPEELKKTAGNVFKLVESVDARLERIENIQRTILEKLNGSNQHGEGEHSDTATLNGTGSIQGPNGRGAN